MKKKIEKRKKNHETWKKSWKNEKNCEKLIWGMSFLTADFWFVCFSKKVYLGIVHSGTHVQGYCEPSTIPHRLSRMPYTDYPSISTRIITGDETWAHYVTPETKNKSKCWHK